MPHSQRSGRCVHVIENFSIGEDQIIVGSSGKGLDHLSVLQMGDTTLIGDRATGSVFAQLKGVEARSLIMAAPETFQ